MKGLNDDPGCRHAWVTWLNLLRLKSKPPTSARTAPSCASSEMKADSTSGSCTICQGLLGVSRCTRMIEPRRMRFCGVVLESSARAAKRSDSPPMETFSPVSYTHLRAHETPEHLVCRLLLEK